MPVFVVNEQPRPVPTTYAKFPSKCPVCRAPIPVGCEENQVS